MKNLFRYLNFFKKNFLESIFFLIIILYFFVILNFEENLGKYVFVENLINYNGGFIRRGFLGALAFFFYENLNWSPKVFFVAIYSLVYFCFIVLFYKVVFSIKKQNFYFLLLIIISPATLLFPVLDTDALFRKEIFLITIFFTHIYYSRLALLNQLSYENYIKINIFFIFPVLFLNILIHEFQFFLLFFHYLINFYLGKRFNKKTKILNRLYLFLGLVFLFVASAGNENTVIDIENSIKIFVPSVIQDYGATDMLDGNINLMIGAFLKMVLSSNIIELLQVFLMLSFSVFLFLYIFNYLIEKNNAQNKIFNNINFFLIFLTILILLIFIVCAFDFGRLFHIVLMHIIGFYLVLPSKNFRFNVQSFSNKIKIQIIIVFYFLFFSMPHAHVIMGKGSMYLKHGSGVINFLIQNFEPFINKILL